MGKPSTNFNVPAPDAGDKKFNSRPVAPTILQNEPIVFFYGGLFAWKPGIVAQEAEFNRYPVLSGLLWLLRWNSFAGLFFLQFKKAA